MSSFFVTNELLEIKEFWTLTKSTFDGRNKAAISFDPKSTSIPCVSSTMFHMREFDVIFVHAVSFARPALRFSINVHFIMIMIVRVPMEMTLNY